MRRRTLVRLAGASALPLVARPALAGFDWPTADLQMIVAAEPGGRTDAAARILAAKMAGLLGKRVNVENEGGRSGSLGANLVFQTPKDGLVLLYADQSFAMAQPLLGALPYNPFWDFSPAARVGVVPMMIAVRSISPVRALSDLITLLRANPGQYEFGSLLSGSAPHMAAEMLNTTLGVQATHVPFRSTALAVQALERGRVEYVCDTASALIPSITTGRIRGIVLTGPRRLVNTPGMPILSDVGVDSAAFGWNVVMTSGGTPTEIVNSINATVNTALRFPDAVAAFESVGMLPDSERSVEFAASFVAEQLRLWDPVASAVRGRSR